ncbi:probable low affinity copper uptake protein 2 isoform X1 [Theropithecus gelada]|uniref:probable low affinity copper uptake protein 2 isoform X1 n=1 Tax=Theropithecus gelada TaxID=9565 RepID=UPI000DC18AF1|nr:probable low affinity copper uptake protein 2 isoform X1 [Theropithecus gelada]
MAMHFIFSDTVVLLFDFWSVHSPAGMALSVLVLLLLAVLYEGIKVGKAKLLHQVVFVSLWPVSNPCHPGGHRLLHHAGRNVLQHLDFPWCGPGLRCGLLPSLPTSQHSLAGEECAGTEAGGTQGPLFHTLYFQLPFLLMAIPPPYSQPLETLS